MELSEQLHAPAIVPSWGKIQVPTEQRRSERFGKDINLLHIPGCEPRTVQPVAQQQYKNSEADGGTTERLNADRKCWEAKCLKM